MATSNVKETVHPRRKQNKETLAAYLFKNKYLYMLLIPGVLYYIVFQYLPIYGITIALKDYNIWDGYWESEWIGFEHFRKLFTSEQFYRILRNSILLGTYKIVFSFPIPIILAILFNEMRVELFKRFVQTTVYLPHFFSWVIVGGLVIQILHPTTGALNELIRRLGGEPIHFLIRKDLFRGILILSHIWKGAGWGTIVYLAAISGIDPNLYEAAIVDGAGRFRMMWYITLPSISNTILVVFIINMGYVLRNSFEQVFVLYNPLVYDVADVFETYVYRTGLLEVQFDYATAVGVFQSLVGMMFLLAANFLANKFGDKGIF